MLTPRFCNYYTDYQQRLGFLKILARTGEGVRGGRDQYIDRLRALYHPRGISRLEGRAPFTPKKLLERDEVPSWQSGFTERYLDRLVNWGEMVGIIATNGRLSEWARILLLIGQPTKEDENPFVLSDVERAFFLQLLLIHDQALRDLIVRLGVYSSGTRLGVRESCLEMLEALGVFAERVKGQGVEAVQMRVELRDLFERIARQWQLDRSAFTTPSRRAETLTALRRETTSRTRNRLVEYHTICRFEQLTDLGLLTKEDQRATSVEERRHSRSAWLWSVTPGLVEVSRLLASDAGIAEILTHHWIELSIRGNGIGLLEPLSRKELIEVLDQVLPAARRQLGPVQVHSWATLACLAALRCGRSLEIGQVYGFLDELRHDPSGGDVIRQGGRLDFLDRTAVVSRDGLLSHFSALEAS